MLPQRSGPRPRTTPTNPHTQLDQQPEDMRVREDLARQLFALPDVEERPSMISVPGARALWLRDGLAAGPAEAFMIGREFAHLHPGRDQSLHTALPRDVAPQAVEAGWAEVHPMSRLGVVPPNVVMIYAPRDDEELSVVLGLLSRAYAFAGGRLPSYFPRINLPS